MKKKKTRKNGKIFTNITNDES
ncbi:protein of unknown function [Rhodovastum atsumiense]|nr:protein of unknown function [Rhodovastum atsumiense]